MLLQVSWRNVWRNKVRSLVLVSSIALGIWAGVFILAFSWGMHSQYVNVAIKGQISHFQLHNPDFKKDKKIVFTIPDSREIIRQLDSMPDVKSASARIIAGGMVTSATTGAGATINGVDPADENAVTGLKGHVIEGAYFASGKRNQLMAGEKLVKKLHLKLGSKIILTFQDVNGDLTSGAFRIAGIFRTRNSSYDESNVFVRSADLGPILGIPSGSAHEIAILLHDNTDLQAVQRQLVTLFPGLLTESWEQLAPELKFVIESFNTTMYLFISIILLALGFGIVNTMMMAVLERVRELGILMALGMNKFKVFFMVMMETIYIALIGGPLGLVLAYFTIYYFGKTGINLSAFAKGLSAYGMDSVVFPALMAPQYFDILLMVFVTAVLAAVYPSLKAIKFKPVDAIRKI